MIKPNWILLQQGGLIVVAPENRPKHHRRSIRLAGHDYTAEGGYYITIVTHGRECLFGNIVNGVMVLNNFGKIVYEEWYRSAKLRPNIELLVDEFVVMPNHIHGIIWLNEFPGRGSLPLSQKTLGGA